MNHINAGQYVWRSRKKSQRAHIVGNRGTTLCKAENNGSVFDQMAPEPPEERRLCGNCIAIRDEGFRGEERLDYENMVVGEFITEDGGTMTVSVMSCGNGRRISAKRFVKSGRSAESLSFDPADGEALVSLLGTAVAAAARLEIPYPEHATPPWED